MSQKVVQNKKKLTAMGIIEPVLRNLGLTLFALFALFPLVWMVLCAFKSDAQMYNTVFIFEPTLDNFKQVLIGTDYF